MDDPFRMERQEVDTALAAANVALSGRRQREASSFASIELREADPGSGRWELVVAAAIGVMAFAIVVAAWLY